MVPARDVVDGQSYHTSGLRLSDKCAVMAVHRGSVAMRVITPADIAGTHRDRMVGDGTAHAMCYLAEEDGCGFSFSTLTIDGDSTGYPLHYRNHIEANLILEGFGEIHNLETDARWPAEPGTLYVVGPADRHQVLLKGPVKVASLFNPPIKGVEHHQDFGGYPPSGPIPEAWGPSGGSPTSRRMFVKQRREIPVVSIGGGHAEARRYLTKADDVGFTISDLTAKGAGEPVNLWYKHHVEANFVVSGTARVTDSQTGESWPLEAGSLYLVGPKD
jgi:L-ectoine synthase